MLSSAEQEKSEPKVTLIEPRIKEIKKEVSPLVNQSLLEKEVNEGAPSENFSSEDTFSSVVLHSDESQNIPAQESRAPVTLVRPEQENFSQSLSYSTRRQAFQENNSSRYATIEEASRAINPSISSSSAESAGVSPVRDTSVLFSASLEEGKSFLDRKYSDPLGKPADKPKHRYPWEE